MGLEKVVGLAPETGLASVLALMMVPWIGMVALKAAGMVPRMVD